MDEDTRNGLITLIASLVTWIASFLLPILNILGPWINITTEYEFYWNKFTHVTDYAYNDLTDVVNSANYTDLGSLHQLTDATNIFSWLWLITGILGLVFIIGAIIGTFTDKDFDIYWAVLGGALTPLPYKIMVWLAGIFEMSFWQFMLVSFIGRTTRYMFVGYLSHYLIAFFS